MFKGQTETCNSLSWYPNDENLLIAGLNNNSLKLYDMRTNTRAVKQTTTKFAHGICLDQSPYTAASFNDVRSFLF